MNKAHISFSNRYPLDLIFAVALFLFFIAVLFHSLVPNYSHLFNRYLSTLPKNAKVYFLISDKTIDFLNRRGFDSQTYIERMKLVQKYLTDAGISYQVINETKIPSLHRGDVLIALDTINLASKTKKELLSFLEQGGRLLFNYHFGYFQDGKYQGDHLIHTITGLRALMEVKHKTDLFITPKLLSPVAGDFQKAKTFDYILYDNVPLFHSNQIPDAVMSNWNANSTPVLEGKQLDFFDAGVEWHGTYKKGTWIYFSFPSYTLTDNSFNMFSYFVKNALHFLKEPVTVTPYPYLDKQKVVFISEDTEYQYQNLEHFSQLANQKKIHVTAFCVGYLAEKYPKITADAAQNPYLEIGSHSYSHTKIIGTPLKNMEREILGSKLLLEKITNTKVVGFRPPREEIDDNMTKILINSGYIYTMEKHKTYIYPQQEYPGLITLPRHGTDDYEYIINLDWNKEKILEQIIKETEFLTRLNILYTLSVHTHLLTYGSNIEILSKYFDYLNQHPDITPLMGKEIALTAKELKNIQITTNYSVNKIFVQITNKNDKQVHHFRFRIYYPNITLLSHPTAEIIGIRTKTVSNNKKEKYMDIEVSKLMPKSTLNIIFDYQ
ncbi:polysaccharide deacetylase family protein [Nitratiruptor sp. SB155-2]|uniref:polysaccharide deacetylase family protein n=1 Tax=Nitratiruptor sp. (strain SB155-2) TaxID=387092 RepID=UPI0001586F83|nr:polysaccharide deacetylase family protein [Nitratiruptor sp. SB155-2]BAF69294.1 hypothetical protein NIS_0180 [Nitratiruptor sp. SB155-2]